MAEGDGTWVPVTPSATGSLRPGDRASLATGYYRPEDLNVDEKALAGGQVRFCGNNTGREQAHSYGETICITDGPAATATTNAATPQVQVLVAGSSAYNMPDNVAYQPGRGNWIIQEDGETDFECPHNNDLWSCLDDGSDDGLLSDGCLRIATRKDLVSIRRLHRRGAGVQRCRVPGDRRATRSGADHVRRGRRAAAGGIPAGLAARLRGLQTCAGRQRGRGSVPA